MTCLLKRLRDPLECPSTNSVFELCGEAADEIERLSESFQFRLEVEASEARKKIEAKDQEIEKLREVFRTAMYISKNSSSESWGNFVYACEVAGGYDAAVKK